MQLIVKGKNVDVTDALRNYARKRMKKIARYFDGIISTDITFSTERNWHIVDVIVSGKSFVLRGSEKTKDMYQSIDLVLDKLEKQIKKQKGKWERKIRVGKKAEEEAFMIETPRGRDDDEMELEQVLFEPRVVRVPMFSTKPMTVEEAIKEMASLGFSFFVFRNVQNDRINVIYKRKTGYGLIDPDY